MKYPFKPMPFCRCQISYQLASSPQNGNNDGKMSEALE